MAELPQFMILKNIIDKYITLSDEDEGTRHLTIDFGVFQFPNPIFEVEVEPRTLPGHVHMFEVEKATTVPGHVHIRHQYTNKYWVRESGDSDFLVVEATEKEEDQSKRSCTLFKPVFLDGYDIFSSKNVQLFHISESCERPVTFDDNCKLGIEEAEHAASDLIVVDAEARLPEYVAFLGPNKRYLVSEQNLGLFSKSDDIGDKGVAQRICYSSSNNTGVMKIMDQNTGSYWTINDQDCVVLGPQEEATSFSAFLLDNRIAIKCMSGPAATKFATITDGGALKFVADTIVENGKLWVEEPVLVREISNVVYESKEYNVKPISKYRLSSPNNETDVEEKLNFQVDYKERKIMSWSRTNTINLGIKCKLSARIPRIGKLGFECGSLANLTLEWGEQEKQKKAVRRYHEVMIPPQKRAILEVVAKRAEFVIPFSCEVHDVLTWGESKRYQLTDGQHKSSYEFGFDDKITYSTTPASDDQWYTS